MTTPLRYPGGKARAVYKKILPLIPLDFSEYREPFLGGGSVFIAVKQLRPEASYWINDLNSDLCCFWKIVRDEVNCLLEEVTRLVSEYKNGKDLYRKLHKPEYQKDDFSKAVRFTILNRITYSGLIDSGGYSSQAFERGIKPAYLSNLSKLSDLLKGVRITNKSYESLLSEKGEEVFIFMDPPYWKSKPKLAKLYGKNGSLHTSFHHSKFAENVKRCKHRWLITYCDSGVIRELFKFASKNIHSWIMSYGMSNINGKKVTRGKELFISNYPLTSKKEMKASSLGVL